jgi:hypothetical protein
MIYLGRNLRAPSCAITIIRPCMSEHGASKVQRQKPKCATYIVEVVLIVDQNGIGFLARGRGKRHSSIGETTAGSEHTRSDVTLGRAAEILARHQKHHPTNSASSMDWPHWRAWKVPAVWPLRSPIAAALHSENLRIAHRYDPSDTEASWVPKLPGQNTTSRHHGLLIEHSSSLILADARQCGGSIVRYLICTCPFFDG